MSEFFSYAELHCLSNFSFLRGALRPKELARRADTLFLRHVLHARYPIEVCILRPKSSPMSARSRKNKAIRHGDFVIHANTCSREGNWSSEIGNLPLLHKRYRLQRSAFASLLEDSLENLVETYGGDDEIGDGFDRRCKVLGVATVGEVFKPAGRIDQIQARSSPRGTSVSIPLRKPRIFFRGRTGINSIRSSYTTTWIFCPGDSFRVFRTCFGMTT